MLGGGAVRGGGDLGPLRVVEEPCEAGEHPHELGEEAGVVEGVEREVEQVERFFDVAVDGFEPGEFAGDGRLRRSVCGVCGCR